VALLERHLERLAEKLKHELAGLSPAERMERITRMREEDGYMAEWHSAGPGEATLREHNCAIHAIAEQYPEICVAEKKLYEVLLGATVERRSHILGGCTACEYHMKFDTPPGAEAPEVVQMRPRGARPGAEA
jgi:predicted ArsR family transcriptional regulator